MNFFKWGTPVLSNVQLFYCFLNYTVNICSAYWWPPSSVIWQWSGRERLNLLSVARWWHLCYALLSFISSRIYKYPRWILIFLLKKSSFWNFWIYCYPKIDPTNFYVTWILCSLSSHQGFIDTTQINPYLFTKKTFFLKFFNLLLPKNWSD